MSDSVNLKIEYLKGKYSLKDMNTKEILSFLETFDNFTLKHIMGCLEHIMARRYGKECHCADF